MGCTQSEKPHPGAPGRRRATLIVSGVLVALAVGACGGSKHETVQGGTAQQATPTKQQTAQKQVCSARASIQSEIDTISGLPLNSASIDKVSAGVAAIRTDLQQMADAQGDLAPARKQQVKAAGKTFESQVKSVAGQAITSGLSGNAADAVRSAAGRLATSFKQALAPIDCS